LSVEKHVLRTAPVSILGFHQNALYKLTDSFLFRNKYTC
jgi:hypothetical protein